MKRIRITGLCLVAAFAMSAIASASASAAEPAFYECKAVKGGKFEKGCKKEGGKGGFSIVEGVGKGKAFKGKGGKATLHTPAVGGEITCTAFKDEGKIATPTSEEKVFSIFTGCATLGKKCTSAGQKKGTIKTFGLKGGLGYIEKAGKLVGVDLSPESGTELAAFECEGLKVNVTGSVIATQTGDINTFSKKSTNAFEVVAGLQKYKELEGGPVDVLESLINGAGPFESGQEASAANTGEELEVKA